MIRVWLTGDKELIQSFEEKGGKVREALQKEVRRLTIELQNKVKRDKLSGTVLQVRTGRLRNSITGRVEERGTAVIGIVGTNVGYGAVHEYGGTVNVPSHSRVIYQAFGRALPAPVVQQVQAHKATYPERSFLRSSLQEMLPTIRQRLNLAVMEAIK